MTRKFDEQQATYMLDKYFKQDKDFANKEYDKAYDADGKPKIDGLRQKEDTININHKRVKVTLLPTNVQINDAYGHNNLYYVCFALYNNELYYTYCNDRSSCSDSILTKKYLQEIREKLEAEDVKWRAEREAREAADKVKDKAKKVENLQKVTNWQEGSFKFYDKDGKTELKPQFNSNRTRVTVGRVGLSCDEFAKLIDLYEERKKNWKSDISFEDPVHHLLKSGQNLFKPEAVLVLFEKINIVRGPTGRIWFQLA